MQYAFDSLDQPVSSICKVLSHLQYQHLIQVIAIAIVYAEKLDFVLMERIEEAAVILMDLETMTSPSSSLTLA